jgi:predicted AAA+ superfamily ATPase
VLTGSANVFTLPRAAEGLAGRMEVLTLWPLTQAELEGTQAGFIDACFEGQPAALHAPPVDRGALVRRLVRGGYPEAVSRTGNPTRRRWFDAYLTTLLQRDLRHLAAVEQVAEVPRILEAVAARTGEPLNVADLGRTLGLDAAGLAARPGDLGQLLESFVVAELLRLVPHSAIGLACTTCERATASKWTSCS